MNNKEETKPKYKDTHGGEIIGSIIFTIVIIIHILSTRLVSKKNLTSKKEVRLFLLKNYFFDTKIKPNALGPQ